MYFLLFFFLLVAVNNFFFLFPWSKIEGEFNTIDIGLLMLALSLIWLFFRKQPGQIFHNVFALYVGILLFMVVFHIFYANIRFDLSYLDSIIASRYSLYYFSFFFFLYIFDKPERFRRALNVMSYIAIVIIALSVVNYFGPVMFYHDWAEGHYERLGVKRAYIPSMSLMSFCAVWSFSRLFTKGALSFSAGWKSAVFVVAHVFRQSRMRLMAAMLVFTLLALVRGNLKKSLVAVVIVAFGGVVIFTVFKSNLLVELFESTYYDLVHQKGTWKGRLNYIEFNFDELMKSPLLGTGSSAIRANEAAYEHLPLAKKEYFRLLGKQTDLGYFIFIRNFGVLGLVWLAAFFMTALKRSWALMQRNKDENEDLAAFCFFYMIFVGISSVTLNHFSISDGIFHICFVLALIVRLHKYTNNRLEHAS